MKRPFLLFLTAAGLVAQPPTVVSENDQLQQLAADFWGWRARFAPFSGDHVNRIERRGEIRDWSAASVEQRRSDLALFQARWKELKPGAWNIPQQVESRGRLRDLGTACGSRRETRARPVHTRTIGKYLEEKVPMDAQTARSEAIAFPPDPARCSPTRSANSRSPNSSPKRE